MGHNSPAPQPIIVQRLPRVAHKGTPHLRGMALGIVVACIAVITSIAGLGKWYAANSAESKKVDAEAHEERVKLHQLQFQMILRSIAETRNEKLTDEEKQRYSNLLRDISYEDVKSLLDGLPANRERRNLDDLKNSNQVEPGEKVTDLQWNNGSPAQIRFFKTKNTSLDFRNIDVYSAAPDACSSKVIPLGNSSTATVQICESHLNQKLELIVIQNSE